MTEAADLESLVARLRQAEEMDRSLGLDILETLFGEAATAIETLLTTLQSDKPGDETAIFTLHIEGERSQMRTQAGKSVVPRDALQAAIRVLEAELHDLENCPIHSTQEPKHG